MGIKKILLIVIIVLFVASVPVAIFLVQERQEIRMRADAASTLSFVPASLSVDQGDIFTLEVELDTDTNIVPAVEMHIEFDPTVFEASNLREGPELGTIFDGPTIPVVGDNQAGTATIVVGDVQSPVEGVGVVALIDFEVIGESNEIERIEFGANTQAGAWGEEGLNVLEGTNPCLVTILGGGSGVGGGDEPTATPMPIATATPTTELGSPTATPMAGVGGGDEPTATPTPIATATPTPTASLTPTVTNPPVATATPPVTGVSLPTIGFMGMGLMLLILGMLVFI